MKRKARPMAGFTLIELITVMVITGILSVLAISHFFARETFDAKEYADQAKSIIRYAQKLAIAQNRPIYVSATADRFAACTNPACGAGTLVAAPGGNNSGSSTAQAQCNLAGNYVSTWLCEGRIANVTLASSRATEAGGSGSYFAFDAVGRPYNNGDVLPAVGSPPASNFTQALVLTFSGSGVNYTVTVEPETGYVH